MTSHSELAVAFHALHRPGNPLVLFNCWNAGSAQAIAASGAPALATGSWSVAAANGFEDGERIPLDLVIANLQRIVACVERPVSLDFEGGYAREPEGLRENLSRVIAAGAVGINFEDQIVGGEGLYAIPEQAARLGALRATAGEAGVNLFVNARTDLFLAADATTHEGLLEAALERCQAYAEAGANGFFVPGLVHAEVLHKLCKKATLPINVMAFPGLPPVAKLAELGVARISYGPAPYRQAMASLHEEARRAMNG